MLQGALRALVDGEESTVREGEVLLVPAGVGAPGRSARRYVRAGGDEAARRDSRTDSARILDGLRESLVCWSCVVVLGARGSIAVSTTGWSALRNQAQNGWKQIDVQLKRRHDLIPNLVNTVKGAMQFEQDTLRRSWRRAQGAWRATGPPTRAARKAS